MANFAWVSSTVFQESEYESAEEIVVWLYIQAHRDMAGVAPVGGSHTAKMCRMSPGKFRRILKRFEAIGKLQISKDGNHIWWKSAIFHSLFKGKFNKNQLKSVQNLLKKWQVSDKFCSTSGQSWLESVAQLYAVKYSLVIPIPALTESELELNKNKKREAPATNPNLKTPERKDVDHAFEHLQHDCGDWTILTRNPGGRKWVGSMVAEFGLETVLEVGTRIKEYYTDNGYHISTEVAKAREKFREWCQRQLNTESDRQKKDDQELDEAARRYARQRK